jgi:choline dehydrogenase-like flavoprotein
MYFVVGSGPSGIACAQALSESGYPVTILDSGLMLEPGREAMRAALAGRCDSNWEESERFAPQVEHGGVPVKLVHGSDYPYRPAPGSADIYQSGRLGIQGSYAAGGFSNVWGGAILPYSQDDLAGWPVSERELRPAYAEVLKLLPVAAERDNLADLFPLHTDCYTPLRQSRQMERFMHSLAKNKSKLHANKVFFGRSRLAIDSAGARSKTSCVYCGRCLHGCPLELIYSSRQSLKSLESHGKVAYLRGITVKSIEERGKSAFIRGVETDGSPCSFEGKRVFLAAGVLNSTIILLRSQNLYDHTVRIKDSQYFLLPMLQFTASPNVKEERLHTLCQAFIEILDSKISKHTIHLQIYSYNDHIARMLDSKLGLFKRFFPRDSLLGRLLLVQGYLHSTHSASIAATLTERGGSDAVYLEPIANEQTKGMILEVVRKLRGLAGLTRATPIGPMLNIADPGRGFHSGGSFPMAHIPGPGQTDRLGRPYGMERLHVVDSTIFPSIPATTITLTVMANAYRIGREVSMMGIEGAA